MRTYGLRFDVNCSILFTELPLLERPAAAKAAGFDAVEFWWPFEDYVPADKEADAFVDAIGNAGVELASLNFHTGDMAAGERGILSDPGRARQFRENVGAVTEVARRAGCPRLNAPYGNRLPDVSPGEQDAVATENLTLAAQAAATIGATILVEAINSVDVPAFPVDTSDKARAVIEKVPAENVAFLADLYHLAKMGENLAETLTRHAGRIAHVQVADPPGRGAPGTGTLGFEPLFAQLSRQGYTGSVGLEYLPSDPADSSASFGWLTPPAGRSLPAVPRGPDRLLAGNRPSVSLFAAFAGAAFRSKCPGPGPGFADGSMIALTLGTSHPLRPLNQIHRFLGHCAMPPANVGLCFAGVIYVTYRMYEYINC